MRVHGLILGACCAIDAGCGGTVVDLGDPRPLPYRFGPARLLVELDAAYANQNPTLTADLRELFFTSNRSGTQGDVWTARRASPADPFEPPARVAAVSSPVYETSPAISLDGLSLYVGSDRDGGMGAVDIWCATRAGRDAPWSGVENLTAVNSAANDIPRPPGQHGLVMPMASERDGSRAYQTYLAARPSLDQPFGAPVIVSGLADAGDSFADAFLSDDGLTLIYALALPDELPDLFVAWRATTADPFSLPAPLTDLNSASDERDPWLSPDGQTMYFSSDRSGALQIYEVAVTR